MKGTLSLKKPSARFAPIPKPKSPSSARKELLQRYPELFGSQRVPLAVGIREQLYDACPDVARKKIRAFLRRRCRDNKYLQAIAAGGPRYGLEGPKGDVAAEEIAHAAEEIAQ